MNNLSSIDTWSVLTGIWHHIDRRRRLQLGAVLVLMLLTGIAELISLGAVIPFLAALVEPERLWNIQTVRNLSFQLGINSAVELRVPAVLVFVFAAVAAALVRILTLLISAKLSASVGSDLSCKLYSRSIYQPYKIHLRRNTSELITTITTHTALTIHAINTVLQIITSSTIAVCILIGLSIANWRVAISSSALFGLTYTVITLYTRESF